MISSQPPPVPQPADSWAALPAYYLGGASYLLFGRYFLPTILLSHKESYCASFV